MLDIGVQTKGILPDMEIDKGFKLIREAGFRKVDINLDTFLKNSDLYAGKLNGFFSSSIEDLFLYFSQYRKAMDRYGIEPSQMHAPYPVRVEGREQQNEYMQGTVIPKSILIAEFLRVPWMVVHPFKMQYVYDKNREFNENIAYFKMLVPLLKQCGVRICFENLYEGIGTRIVEGVCADPEDAVKYIDTLNDYAGEELFGFCLDTGHLQLVNRDPYAFMTRLGSRLKALHIHENNGVGDLHQLPFTFGKNKEEGQIWNRIFEGLAETGFDRTLSFETFPCMNSFPKGMRSNVLSTIYGIGSYMREEIEIRKSLESVQKKSCSKTAETMKIGIIGTGRIAARFLKAAEQCYGIKVTCVYNPHIESAERFCKNTGIVATDDLERFMESIEGAYIASPHETHFTYAKVMLENGIHVLCEKPAVLNANDAELLYELAAKNKLIFMEAIKTAYCPGFKKLVQEAKSGKIGRIMDVEAAFTRLTPVNTREYMEPVYGGSFLEFGSYVMLPVLRLLGCDFEHVRFTSIRAANGTDAYTKAYFEYKDKTAVVKTGLGVKSEGQLLLSGTKGYLLAKSPWWMTKEFDIRYEDPGKIEHFQAEYDGSGLQYELEAFIAAVANRNLQETASEHTEEEHGVTKEESIAMGRVIGAFLDWNKEHRGKKEKDSSGKLKIWAHRGCSFAYPENTLEAFEAAAKIPGITGIELDIQLSSDGEIVVFHDENAKRVTGEDRNIADSTLKEIKSLRIRSVDDNWTSIPTLEEVLRSLKPYCIKNGLLINIELKTSVIRYDGIEKKAMNMVKAFGLNDYVVWSSFLPDSIRKIKQIEPSSKTGILALSNEDCIRYAALTGADALHPHIGGLVHNLPEEMRTMPVRVWNADEPFFNTPKVLTEPDLTKYANFGATDIFTNLPERYLGER